MSMHKNKKVIKLLVLWQLWLSKEIDPKNKSGVVVSVQNSC